MNKAKANVILLGDAAAGKSSLLQMYLSNGSNYLKDYNMTQGVDIQTKLILGDEHEKDIEFYFFDAGGHPIFKHIIEGIFKNANYVILVYDCTSKQSFEYITKAHDDLKKSVGKNLPGVLVATKRDLNTLKVVDISEGNDLAKRLGLTFVEVSSLKNHDVDKVFQALKELVQGGH